MMVDFLTFLLQALGIYVAFGIAIIVIILIFAGIIIHLILKALVKDPSLRWFLFFIVLFGITLFTPIPGDEITFAILSAIQGVRLLTK